jgi:hypothetical protein
MSLREALDRTLLLIRDEVGDSVDDDTLLGALTGTRVALISDSANIATHSAQTAFVTSALLMARSGHQVHLLCPDAPLNGPQPPLSNGQMISQLVKLGADLLPGIQFSVGPPRSGVDLAIAVGDSKIPVRARRQISLNAASWSGRIDAPEKATRWVAENWPLGAMTTAAMAATEAFKVAMKQLQHLARNPDRMTSVFADTTDAEFALAPTDTPICPSLGDFDCISGGAIVNSVLYALARLPGVSGNVRIIEHDRSALSNMNRYMLLLSTHLKTLKAEDLAAVCNGAGLQIQPLNERYEQRHVDAMRPATAVLVGVDDIPTRWLAQRANPNWLGVGATTHWSAMASFHRLGLGCAECLHPTDDPSDAPIPTVAFVSFWAGLLTAGYFLRHLGGTLIGADDQQVYLTAFRPENAMHSPVTIRRGCPSCKAVAGVEDSQAV